MERYNRILEIVTGEEKIEVARLAAILGVSQVTIRKDLDFLERKGLIRREHGYALLETGDNSSIRLVHRYETKKRIAEKAASLVKDWETIFVESGSCCTLLAEYLAENRTGVTIITNSAYIADFVRLKNKINIILLGGDYQKKSQVTVGPMVKKCASDFFADKFFVGIDGYYEKFGFTGMDHLRAGAVADLSEQVKEIIVLAESDKFTKRGSVSLLPFEKVKKVVTDNLIEEETLNRLKDKSIDVLTVESAEE